MKRTPMKMVNTENHSSSPLIESDFIEDMDKKALLKKLTSEDRIILEAYESGYGQK